MKIITRAVTIKNLKKYIGQDLRTLALQHGITTYETGKQNKGWKGLVLERLAGLETNVSLTAVNRMKDTSRRWWALIVLCLATLMVVLDTTIVNVALPSIQGSLGFSSTSLAWVINAYALTYAGFLLLGGRLGDLYGQRRFFILGIVLFTLCSLACGLATSELSLIAARAIQGIGGAVASAISLSLVMNMFPESDERAK